MGFSQNCIDWTYSIISRDFSTPLQDKKAEFAYTLLDTAHRLDLQRCYSGMDHEKQEINKNLFTLFPERTATRHSKFQGLFTLAEKLIQATGCQHQYKSKGYNHSLFSTMSLNGGLCWQTVCQHNI
jgi:hypothetical protein